MVEQSKYTDIVVSSRFNEEGLEDWNMFRKTLTFIGHFLTRFLLNIKYDATGAFRVYNLDIISKEIFKLVNSKGYSFFFESLFILNLNNYSISEIPIKLPNRTYGHSKMKMSDIANSLKFLITLFIKSIFMKRKFLIKISGHEK